MFKISKRKQAAQGMHQTPIEQELVSDEMSDFISNKPHWIVRKGNSLFLLLLIIFLCLSWFIETPDTITTSMRIVAVDAPKLLVARTEGKMVKLLANNDQFVTVGQPIAFLQSTADHQQIISLMEWVKLTESGLKKDDMTTLLHHPLFSFDALGELQPAYQEFKAILSESLQILSTGFYQQKKQALLKELADMEDVQKITWKQKELTAQDFELQKGEYAVKEILAKENVVAPLEFNQDKSKLLSKQQVVEQYNAQIVNSNIAVHSKQKEILELQKFIYDQGPKFNTAMLTLKSKLQEWMQHYVVTAPISGKLSYVGFLQESQYIQREQELFYIIPDSTTFYGEAKGQQQGLGKIKQGQKVIIKVNSYPSSEFGYLSGIISYIPSLIKNDSSFLIKVDFMNGLKTNYGKELVFKSNMTATAEIITDNRRLPERLWGKWRDLINK
jgi:multidrug efflux pump subunit AcrA (membrane-fusion protein)